MVNKLHRFLVCLLALGTAGSAWASFQWPFASVRAAALGGAWTAPAEGASALFSNPAGAAGLKNSELSLSYTKPFAGLAGVDLNAGNMSLAVPTPAGTLGAGIAAFQAAGLVQERTLAVSYGVALGGAHIGVAAKQLSHSYMSAGDALAENDPVFRNGRSRNAMSFDAGFTVPVGSFLTAGATARNINQPNVGLATDDRVGREVQAGLSVNMSGLGLKASGDMLLADPQAGGQRAMPLMGLEKSIAGDRLALRLGANPNGFSGGFGVRVGQMSIDYAIVVNRQLMQDNAGSHQMGIRYGFGGRSK